LWLFNDPDKGFNYDFYIINDQREVIAEISEIDNDKYHDYNRDGRLIEPERFQKDKHYVTYPFPSFYVIDEDGNFKIDSDSDVAKLLKLMKEFSSKYDKYIKNFNELTDTASKAEKLDSLRSQILALQREVPDWDSYNEFKKYANFISFGEFPQTSEEVIKYLNNLYLQLRAICVAESPNVKSIETLHWNFKRKISFYSDFIDLKVKVKLEHLEIDDRSSISVNPLPENSSELFVPKTNKNKKNDIILKEFNNMIRRYNRLPEYTRGCGRRGQYSIDDEYKRVIEFQQLNNNNQGVGDRKIEHFQ